MAGSLGAGFRARVKVGAAIVALLLVAGCFGAGAAFAVPPSVGNDNFANAQPITGATGDVVGYLGGATHETGEPGSSGDRSVWYTWTAPQSGAFYFGEGDNHVSVYTGAAVGALTEVAARGDWWYSGYRIVTAGQTYRIRVWYPDTSSLDQISLSWQPTSVISGRVTADGVPASNAEAYLYQEYSDGWYWWDSDSTDGTGSYAFASVDPGTYRVGANSYSSTEFTRTWYGGTTTVESAADIVVGSGELKSIADIALRPSSHIKGTVTDAVTGDPVENVEVAVATPAADGTWDWGSEGWTNAAGAYVISRIPAGTYRVGFFPEDDHADQYSGGHITVESADGVAVSQGATATCDAELLVGSHIKGTVTDAQTDDPVEGVFVSALMPTSEDFAGYAWTDENGEYDIGGLAARDYRVSFTKERSGVELVYYADQYYDATRTVETAKDVNPGSASTTSGIDAALQRESRISGRVTDAATHLGIPWVEARPYVLGNDGRWTEAAHWDGWTDKTGEYDISGLAAGTYKVGFFEEMSAYEIRYNGGGATLAAAPSFTIDADDSVTDVDAALAEFGHITGRVTDAATGLPVVELWVEAYKPADDGCVWHSTVVAYTDADGRYTLHGVGLGATPVAVLDGGRDAEQYGGITYEDQYYSDKSGFDNANLVSVPSVTTTVTGIDFQMRPRHAVTSFLAVDGAMSGVEGVAHGRTASFRVWPARGHRVKRVFVVGGADAVAGPGGTWTVPNVTSDIQIGAEFEEGLYSATPAGTSGGYISGGGLANFGDDAFFTVTPAKGFVISRVFITGGGTLTGSGSSWTVHDIMSNTVISAEFVRATSVSIKGSPSKVKKKRYVKLSGKVSSNLGKKNHVTIWALKPGSSTWVKLKTVHTTSSHKWSWSYKLKTKGYYYFQARFAGKPGYAAASSGVKRIRCK